MICCKCKKPIKRSYGRVTDYGNYCQECAKQNEFEAEKGIVAIVNQIIDETRKETARDILKAVLEDVGEFYAGDIVEELAKKYGVEVEE